MEKFEIVNNKEVKKKLESMGFWKLINKKLDEIGQTKILVKFHPEYGGNFLTFPDNKLGISLVSKNYIILCIGTRIWSPFRGHFLVGVQFFMVADKYKEGNWAIEDHFEATLKDIPEDPSKFPLFCAKVRSTLKRIAQTVDTSETYHNLRSIGLKASDF